MTLQSHRYDLFISYAAADRAWVEGYLLDALIAAGVSVISEDAFELGAPRLTEFERAVKESRRVLLVISLAYLADDAAGFVDLLSQQYGMDTGTWPVIPLIREEAWRPVHGTLHHEWAAFTLARSLDDETACQATGMGFAGIMGFNHELLGYNSARQMFEALSTGERRQILGYFDFIAGPDGDSRRLRTLRDGNLSAFAALHWGVKNAARKAHALSAGMDALERLRGMR